MSKAMNQKSTTAVLVALGMATSSLAPLAMAPRAMAQVFSDVQGSWAQTCIVELTERGVISGYPDGSFRPNNAVTRAEFAAMVGKAFPNAARVRGATQFVDVPSSFWAYNAVSYASQTGFLSGYPGNVFNPSQSIPRAQVLVSLASGLNYSPTQPVNATLTNYFADASAIPGYAETGIAAATERRLVVNHPDVRYLNPNQLASRAEVSAFLCQALTQTGQISSVISSQYVAGATVAQQAVITAGTTIPVNFTAAEQIIVAPNEAVDLALTVASDIRNSQGVVAIPAGSQLVGQLVPVSGGSQFVANTVVINGRQYAINASSGVIASRRNVRDPNIARILGTAAVGSSAAAIIGGVTGNRQITGGNVLLGGAVAGAAAASQGRNIGKTIRDAAIGAALGAGAAGITGDRTITPKEALTGAALGAAVGGSLDRSSTGEEVIVINPQTDLTVTVNNNVTL